jgi:hypothetical protein
MPTYRLKTTRLDDEDTGSLIDNAIGEVEAAVAGLMGINLDQDYNAVVQLLSGKNVANGYAGLDANGLMDSDIGLDPAVANGTASGVKELGIAGETVAFGDSVYLKASDVRWYKTNAGASATSILRIAMCLAAGNTGDSVGILDIGYIAKTGWAWTTTGPLFLSAVTSGGLTETAPSGVGKFVRIAGHPKSPTIVHFKPDNCWVELGS